MTDQTTTYDNTTDAADTSRRVSAQQISSDISPLAATPAPSLTPTEAPAKHGNLSKATRGPGAPRGNAHALRTGLRSPKCPPAARGIDAMRYSFRRAAFADYRARHALKATEPVPFYVECRIDAAVRHHKNALLIEWLIRTQAPPTDAAGKAAYADRMQAMLDKAADFTDRRDKALREASLSGVTSTSDAASDWAARLAALEATP